MIESSLLAMAIGGVIFFLGVNQALHKIEEGHVGVYYRGGALLNDIAHPGKTFVVSADIIGQNHGITLFQNCCKTTLS